MYNLRYHIASLVAVFLALSVGLILGTVVAERGMITDQTSSLVADLQARFDELQASNDALEVGLERDRSFAETAVAPLVSGQLAGKNIAVIITAEQGDAATGVAETIAAAGGTSFTVTLQRPGLGLGTEEAAGLAGLFQLHGIEIAEPGEALEQQVAERLVGEWRAGAAQPLTELLAGEELVRIESASGTATVDAVVIVGTGGAGCDSFALAVARSMSAAGGTAAGVESKEVPDGVAAACAGEGLSAVNHLATPQGKVSLVWVLAGRARGYYGSGADAEAFFPALAP
jgi:hypothetical protein